MLQKQFRRVATRYEGLAANHLALVQLASIRLWLRLSEPRPRVESSDRRVSALSSLGVLDCGDTLSPTLPRKRGREPTSFVARLNLISSCSGVDANAQVTLRPNLSQMMRSMSRLVHGTIARAPVSSNLAFHPALGTLLLIEVLSATLFQLLIPGAGHDYVGKMHRTRESL